MDASYLTDWLNLLFRWVHIIFGAAWIGTSFYFNWLNNNLRVPERAEEGVDGELWSVHGGHFYRVIKYQVAPAQLPKTLHWFKWEAYLTWITGICLLTVVYYLGGGAFMVNPETTLSANASIAVGVASLVAGWLVYHALCKTSFGARRLPFALTIFALITLVAYALTELMSARAAYVHVGALLGTCMALNVFFVIIPNQRKMVDAMIAGNDPDPALGKAGALRSLHNNYMTLPVLFIMVSNHFPMTFGHHFSWAVLAAIGIIGAGTRHWFNLKDRGIGNSWLLPASAVALLSLAFVMSPYAQGLSRSSTDRAEPVTFAEANQIIVTRCTPCHARTPTFQGFLSAPKGIIMETPAEIAPYIGQIDTMAVKSMLMPLGNLTRMTQGERDLLGQWIREGAPLE